MKLQVILSSIVIGILLYSVYLLTLVKGFEWEVYETEIAVALTVTAIGVGYWGFKPVLQKVGIKLEEYEQKIEHKVILKSDPNDEVAHLQNLNTVYQKLFQMRLWETSQNIWVMQALVELNGDQLMHAMNIPDLDRAMIHLKQNNRFENLVDLWDELGTYVSTYNKNIPSFIEFLENYIHKIMSEKTKHIEQKNDEEGYHVNSMRRALMYLLPLQAEGLQITHSFHFRISKIYNFVIWFETQSFFLDNGLFLVINGNAEKIRDEIGKLLLEITMDKTVLDKYKSHYDLLQKMKSTGQKFKDNLEPLIHDIEKNGFTVKGECDLGY